MSSVAGPPVRSGSGTPLWVSTVFLLSGFAALVYQVTWQRVLFAAFGSNVESVTVVVTAFMLGLGFGSLAGGVLSRDPTRPLLRYFSRIELAIGVFGALSVPLFQWASSLTLGLSTAATAIVMTLLLLLPTMLMGSTLPLLVAYAVPHSQNVGRSVGTLYFVNTLGSALAGFASALLLLRTLGLQRSVFVAVALNGVAGLVSLFLSRREPNAL